MGFKTNNNDNNFSEFFKSQVLVTGEWHYFGI